MTLSIHQEYKKHGVSEYYKWYSDEYRNPHEYYIFQLLKLVYNKFRHHKVLDFACGDGLVSKFIGQNSLVVGCDPYMNSRYISETNNACYPYSFLEFIDFNNAIDDGFDVVFISYAFDLIPKSLIEPVLYRMSLISKELILIRPNKHIMESSYWTHKITYTDVKSSASIYTSNTMGNNSV